jgi:hypothetical protein
MDLLDAEEIGYSDKAAGSVDASNGDQATPRSDNTYSMDEKEDDTQEYISDTEDDKGESGLKDIDSQAYLETKLTNLDDSSLHSIEVKTETSASPKKPVQDTESIIGDMEDTNNGTELNNNDESEFEFDEFRDNQTEDFGEFGAFDENGQDGAGGDDDFGDFDEFEDIPDAEPVPAEQEVEKHVEGIEGYVCILVHIVYIAYRIFNVDLFSGRGITREKLSECY